MLLTSSTLSQKIRPPAPPVSVSYSELCDLSPGPSRPRRADSQRIRAAHRERGARDHPRSPEIARDRARLCEIARDCDAIEASVCEVRARSREIARDRATLRCHRSVTLRGAVTATWRRSTVPTSSACITYHVSPAARSSATWRRSVRSPVVVRPGSRVHVAHLSCCCVVHVAQGSWKTYLGRDRRELKPHERALRWAVLLVQIFGLGAYWLAWSGLYLRRRRGYARVPQSATFIHLTQNAHRGADGTTSSRPPRLPLISAHGVLDSWLFYALRGRIQGRSLRQRSQ